MAVGSFPWGVLMHITKHASNYRTSGKSKERRRKKVYMPHEMFLELQLCIYIHTYMDLASPSSLSSYQPCQTRWVTLPSSALPAPVRPSAFAPAAPFA